MLQRTAFAVVVMVTALGCGGSENSPSPASPSSTTTLDLTGTWRGTIQLGSGNTSFQWTAARSGGQNFTGEARMGGGAGPVFGTLGGTLSGTQLMATISFPAGAFTATSPTLSGCSVIGGFPSHNGTLTVSETTVSGRIQATWSAGCQVTGVQGHDVSLSKVVP